MIRGLHHFIIELKEPLKDTFVTENGTELYASKTFSVDRLSNRVAKVVSTPLLHSSVIQAGYEVMFEPTILYKQIYQGVTQHYTALLDSKDMLFRLDPNMIILYRKDSDSEWTGHLENCMLEPIVCNKNKVVSSFIIVPESTIPTYEKERAILKYANQELNDLGAYDGDEVIINPAGGVKFWIEGKEYWWIRNVDIFGLIEKVA